MWRTDMFEKGRDRNNQDDDLDSLYVEWEVSLYVWYHLLAANLI